MLSIDRGRIMGKLGKTFLLLGASLCTVTTMVAAKNANDVHKRGIQHKYGFYAKYIKRPQDFFCAGAASIVLSPMMLLIALLVKIKLGSPILFLQDRPGLDEKIFRLYKFRTMTEERDESGEMLPDSVRLTPFGSWLRQTSLDELPELFNIMRGDMSLIGPRPLLVQYLPYYTEDEKRRHEVRPGLTGLAQVNGRNYLPWDDRLAMDVEYVETISLLGDVQIALKTIKTVFERDGVAVNTEDAKEGYLDQIREGDSN